MSMPREDIASLEATQLTYYDGPSHQDTEWLRGMKLGITSMLTLATVVLPLQFFNSGASVAGFLFIPISVKVNPVNPLLRPSGRLLPNVRRPDSTEIGYAPQPLGHPRTPLTSRIHSISDGLQEQEAAKNRYGILSPLILFFGSVAWILTTIPRGLAKLATQALDANGPADLTQPVGTQPFWKTVWDFSRPHTLIGSALCVPALHYFAAPTFEAAMSPMVGYSILSAMLPAFLINIFITGLNQITDVDIDRVNKPYLPIASGALSMRAAIITVLVCLALGLGAIPFYAQFACLAPYANPALQATLIGSAVLGTIYSVPPFRLKRYPLLAATCILAVRGLVINIGFYAHALYTVFGGIGGPLLTLPFRDIRCGLAALFFVYFGVVIALMKDVPDIKGDREAGIRTFTVRAGAETMFRYSNKLLVVLFGGMAVFMGCAGVSGALAGLYVAGAVRMAVALTMLYVTRRVIVDSALVDGEDSKGVYSYYMFLWKLFYASYLALPFIR